MGWVIAAPACAGALAVMLLATGRVFPTESLIATAHQRGTFADALAGYAVEEAYSFVRAGYDVNAAIRFRSAAVTDDREVYASPLLIAVAARRDNSVRMLLSFGARPDLPQNRMAACLADQLGETEVARIIRAAQSVEVRCPQPSASAEPPLVALTNSAGGSD